MNCTSYALFLSTIITQFKQHFYIRTRLARRLIPVRTEILVNGEPTLWLTLFLNEILAKIYTSHIYYIDGNNYC